jgi:Tfp pilus assembly protein PilN
MCWSGYEGLAAMTLNLLPWRAVRKKRFYMELVLVFLLPVLLMLCALVYQYQNYLTQQNNNTLLQQKFKAQFNLLHAERKEQDQALAIGYKQANLLQFLNNFANYLPKGCYLHAWHYVNSTMTWDGVAQAAVDIQALIKVLSANSRLEHVQVISIKSDPVLQTKSFELKANFHDV